MPFLDSGARRRASAEPRTRFARTHRRALCFAVALVVLVVHSVSTRAEVLVGLDASLSLGAGTLSLGCESLEVSGSLLGGSGNVQSVGDLALEASGVVAGDSASFEIRGDWSNLGTFDPGSSDVRFTDGCGRSSSSIHDATSFAALTVDSATGKTYSFAAGETQTVLGSLAIHGDESAPVRIESTSEGLRALIDLAGEQEISFVHVQDHEAIGERIAPGRPAEFQSVDAGNNVRWFHHPLEIPTTSVLGRWLLVAVIGGAACWRLRSA